MAFAIDRFLELSKAVNTADLDWSYIREVGVTDDEARSLRYMSDVESHTIIFLRDLLAGHTARDREITAFLSCWVYEETQHGYALDKFLNACGRPRDRNRFAYLQADNVSTMGQGALDEFLDTPRAVRWWHISETFGQNGISLAGDASQGGMSNAPVARVNGTRLTSNTREDLTRVIIIVDANRVQGVQLAALADYVSMVALAQINPHASTTDYPTIMNLFSGTQANAGAPTAMTQWDQAFLDALYKSARNTVNPAQQRAEIARRMLGANS